LLTYLFTFLLTYLFTFLLTYLLSYLLIYFLTYLLTHVFTYFLKEHSTYWEANSSSASQEIPRILWNSKVHYRINKCPPTVPNLRQLDPVHTLTSHFLRIHLIIILSSMPASPKWPLSLRFPHQNPVYASPLPHTHYMHRPPHFSLFHHPKIIKWAVQIMKLLITQFSPLPCHLVPLRLKYSPQHPILKHPLPTLLPQCEQPCSTPTQNNRQNYISVYFNLFIFI